jgi:hydroxyacylglutathione hydrolase
MEILKHKSGNANMYFIRQAVGWILVDAGKSKYRRRLMRFMNRNGIHPCDIKLILITHVHYDHVGNLHWLKSVTRGKIMVHKSEVDNLCNGTMDDLKASNLFAQLALFLLRLFPRYAKFKSVQPDIIHRNDMDLSDLGLYGRIVHTPGHSKGSLSLILPDNSAFVGDLCFNLTLSSGVFPVFYQDKKQVFSSWNKLNELGATCFYPGHGKKINLTQFYNAIKGLSHNLQQ